MSEFDFEAYRVDPWDSSAVAAALHKHGIATVEGITGRDDLTAAAAAFMRTRTHRDAEPDSITDIRPDTRLQARAAGTGFSCDGVAPHTEGSSLSCPPRLLFLVCVRPAARGGETILVDGAAVCHDLEATDPEAFAVLSCPGAVGFGTAGHRAAVFDGAASGSVALRYRDDDLVEVAPSDRRAWESLRKAVTRHQMCHTLRASQGVLVDNTRWLHGRSAFEGERLIYRLIGDPLNSTLAIHVGSRSLGAVRNA